MHLSEEAEEVASFYGRMIEHDYTTKDQFNKNFFKDWRKTMTPEEKEIITDLKKCNFKQINAYFQKKTEERKAMSKEEKKVWLTNCCILYNQILNSQELLSLNKIQ